jgi:hypothetical protein
MVPLPDEISEQIDKLMSLPANQPDLSRPGNGYHGNAAASAVTNHPKA